MKAVQLPKFGIENLIVNEVESPSPSENEVLVRIKAVSLNYLDNIIDRVKAAYKKLEEGKHFGKIVISI